MRKADQPKEIHAPQAQMRNESQEGTATIQTDNDVVIYFIENSDIFTPFDISTFALSGRFIISRFNSCTLFVL